MVPAEPFGSLNTAAGPGTSRFSARDPANLTLLLHHAGKTAGFSQKYIICYVTHIHSLTNSGIWSESLYRSHSSKSSIVTSFLQGSVLGPLLLLIFNLPRSYLLQARQFSLLCGRHPALPLHLPHCTHPSRLSVPAPLNFSSGLHSTSSN